jgi:hypothetical protein
VLRNLRPSMLLARVLLQLVQPVPQELLAQQEQPE